MARAPLTMNVKFLEHCKPGELVRARFGPNVEWGIVGYEGANSQQQRRVVVISGDNSPWCLNPEDAVSACLIPTLRLGDSRGIPESPVT